MGVRPLFLLLVGVFARVGLCIVLCLVGAGCWAVLVSVDAVCFVCLGLLMLICVWGAFFCIAMNVCLGVFLCLK